MTSTQKGLARKLSAAEKRKLSQPGTQARFWQKVDKSGDCWTWKGWKAYGYGMCFVSGRNVRAHRIAYYLTRPNMDESLSVDHTCRNRACVNPAHMELVTMKENVLRGVGLTAQRARQTHCHKGHPLSGSNLGSTGQKHKYRRCKICYNAQMRRLWAKSKLEAQ